MKTNFTFYLKSSLMVLFLCLGLSSWGQTETITITQTSAGIAQTGYDSGAERTWTQDGVDFGAKAVMKQSGQDRIQFQANNGVIYNTSPLPGKIVSISIDQTASNVFNFFGGNTTRLVNNTSANYTVTGGTQVGSSSSTGWNASNFNETNYTFFAIKKGSGVSYVSSITIEYEVATSCEASNIAFTDTTVNKDLLDPSFTQTATSLNATTAVTYESSDELVATVNATTGEVALVGIGTATITATQEAGEHSGVDYCAGTATYELTVITTEPLLTVSTNSVSFTGFAGGATSTETITVEGFNLTGNIALALSGDTNFSINPTSLSSTGGAVTITYMPSATPATHSATLTVSNSSLSEVITLSGVTNEMPAIGCFEESFDSITTGNSTSSSGSSSVWNGNSNFPIVSTAYQAGGAVRLGSSGGMGSITSVPLTDYAGQNVTISFSSKAWGTASTSILVSFGTQSQVVNLPAVANWTDGLSDYEIAFENIEANAVLKFESNSTSERRFFIDNIAVCLDVPSTDPALSVSESEITDLNYGENNGPSAPQSFILSGENLDGSDVAISVAAPFEVSTSETTGFTNLITLPAYDGTDATIWVRLATGQTVGDYNGTVAISGGDADTVNVTVSGSVLAVPVVTDAVFEGAVGVAFNEQITATENPNSYAYTGTLPTGLDFDTTTGEISGTPETAGDYSIEVTATNAAGTSTVGGIVIEIAKGTQTLDGFTDLTKYDTDAPFDLPETTQAGLAVSYASSNTAVATVADNIVTITGQGTITITATQTGDANWNEFEQTITLTVTEEPAGPCLVETFDAGNPEWTMENVSYTESIGTASFNSQNGYLVTPELSFPNNLNFDLARTGNNNSKTFYVEISTVSPTEGFGSPIATYDHNNTTSGGTTSITVDLADYSSQSSVYIRFRKESSTTSPWRLDNIEVFCNEAPITTPITWTTEGVWSNITGPTISDDVVIEGDLTTANFSANTLTVNGTIVIASGDSVTVQGAIVNNGDFTVEAGGNLIQVDDVENTGAITVEVKAMTEWFGYNMFSSPVAGQAFTDFSSNNGNEVYTYDYANPDGWVSASGGFVEGEGYLFAAPYTGFPQGVLNPFFGEFVGVPHNGAVSVNVAENSFVSLGNPYPSAIDADELLVTNNNIGTLYFWTNTHFYDAVTSAYPGNNYATYTLVGGVGTGEQAEAGGNAFPTPNGAIQTGQGFIAGIATGGTITFDNTMRFATGGTFYKVMEEDKHRLWLSLADQNNELNQILVGYMEGASQGVDTGIDGPMFGYDGSALYSLIENSDTNYVIQGRYPFATADVVPLGFRAIEGGSYTISLANFDGLFAEGQDIFLKDNATQTYHDLKAGAYTFVSEQGVFESRFEVVYQADGGLSTNNPTLDNKWIVYAQDNGFQIETQGFELKEVAVYDMLGRLVYNNQAEGTSHTISNIANGVLIVKVITTDNQVLTRKTAK